MIKKQTQIKKKMCNYALSREYELGNVVRHMGNTWMLTETQQTEVLQALEESWSI